MTAVLSASEQGFIMAKIKNKLNYFLSIFIGFFGWNNTISAQESDVDNSSGNAQGQESTGTDASSGTSAGGSASGAASGTLSAGAIAAAVAAAAAM